MASINRSVFIPEQNPGKPPFFPNEKTYPIPVPELVYIPPGTFWMGSSDHDHAAAKDEKPLHRVYLDGYWIGRYPVTVGEYAAFIDDLNRQQGSKPRKANQNSLPGVLRIHIHMQSREYHPVTDVSWMEAITYCRWLSSSTRRCFSLPTEAQWEKAARGSEANEEEERIYPWGNQVPDRSKCNIANWFGDTTPVGKFSPRDFSPYECADMSGNVLEWCGDWYRADVYTHSTCRNPTGPIHGTVQVLRGGCWCYPPVFARIASRLWLNPLCRYDMIGFRVVMR